jgi:REP element-mobilizing transposase RayT
MKQMKFREQDFKLAKPFGGSLLRKAKNRTARPLSTKKSMHVVIRSKLAKGEMSLAAPKNRKLIDDTLKAKAKKFGVKVYKVGNGGNHLHMIIKLGNRYAYNGFIRAFTGTLALKITRSNKFKKLKEKFWESRPYSRVIEWGRAYSIAKDYLLLNELETCGILTYSKNRLRGVLLRPFAPP